MHAMHRSVSIVRRLRTACRSIQAVHRKGTTVRASHTERIPSTPLTNGISHVFRPNMRVMRATGHRVGTLATSATQAKQVEVDVMVEGDSPSVNR